MHRLNRIARRLTLPVRWLQTHKQERRDNEQARQKAIVWLDAFDLAFRAERPYDYFGVMRYYENLVAVGDPPKECLRFGYVRMTQVLLIQARAQLTWFKAQEQRAQAAG